MQLKKLPSSRSRLVHGAIASGLLAVLALGCGSGVPRKGQRLVDPGAANPEPVHDAVAVLHPVGGSHVSGVVHFSDAAAGGEAGRGLEVDAQVDGLPPGTHAFHVHLLGDCRGDSGKLAGTHFNFEGRSRHPESGIDRITGNLGELVAGDDGVAVARAEVPDARLQGPHSIIGRSVIVHAAGNHPDSPPIGAAGARIACGVIGLTEGRSAPSERAS